VKIDLALILTAAAALTGLIWAVDALFFAKKRRLMQAEGEEVAEPVVVDYARSLFPIIFVVLVLRSFLAEPFRIPSISMMPTLLVGDFILVNKFAYGIRLPVLNTRIIEVGEPQRGDVVVFRYPGNPRIPNDPAAGQDFIKRPDPLRQWRADPEAAPGRRLCRCRRPGPADDRGDRIPGPTRRGQPPQPRDEPLFGPQRQLGGPGRPLLHDGRQPRPQRRQPGLGFRAGREPRRQGLPDLAELRGHHQRLPPGV
jgi:signal peptidase I